VDPSPLLPSGFYSLPALDRFDEVYAAAPLIWMSILLAILLILTLKLD
jgi:hypothetical protein